MNNYFEELKKYFDETPREKVLEDWEKSREFDNVGISVDEFIQNTDDTKIQISLEVFTDHMITNEFTIVGYMLHIPTVGNIFRLHDENSNNFVFSTLNPVIEIEDEFNFKTERCSYRIKY